MQDFDVIIFEQESLHSIELVGVVGKGVVTKLSLLRRRLELSSDSEEGGLRWQGGGWWWWWCPPLRLR
jgi:hypothetical protein